jgi:hypothetical protein
MSEMVEDLLRLAREADKANRPGMRDALLTLVVAESGADDAVLAERCRRLLVAHRPDHCFAATATLGQALQRPQVAAALGTLRGMYPPVRVRHLLLRAEAAHGPFQPHRLPTARIVEDLSLNRAVAPAAARRRRPDNSRPLPFPTPSRHDQVDPDGKMAVFYASVLFALALLLESVLLPGSSDKGSKAA